MLVSIWCILVPIFLGRMCIAEYIWFLIIIYRFACHFNFSESIFSFQKQAAQKDVYQLFAEKVRDHKDLVSRWAVLQETRVEYFRGKDFVSFLRNHPELKDILESDKNLEADDIANALLRKNLLARCDRVVKTVRPGKKKLSTWPAHLEIFPVCNFDLHVRFKYFDMYLFFFIGGGGGWGGGVNKITSIKCDRSYFWIITISISNDIKYKKTK